MGEGEGREGRGSILVPPPGKNPMDAHDISFQWEKPIFDPSQKPNPLTYNHKNWHD
jgi:hypothetical protein